MSPYSFWTIILRIFGLYFFVQFFSFLLPQLIYTIAFVFSNAQQENPAGGIDVSVTKLSDISASFFIISIYLFMFIAFIFKTDWMINALRLNKAITEEKLELNIHRSTVLQIATIVSGCCIFIQSAPSFLKGLFDYYQNINLFNGFKTYPRGGYIFFDLIKVFISFFMITSSRLIVNFIERKRKVKVKKEKNEL